MTYLKLCLNRLNLALPALPNLVKLDWFKSCNQAKLRFSMDLLCCTNPEPAVRFVPHPQLDGEIASPTLWLMCNAHLGQWSPWHILKINIDNHQPPNFT